MLGYMVLPIAFFTVDGGGGFGHMQTYLFGEVRFWRQRLVMTSARSSEGVWRHIDEQQWRVTYAVVVILSGTRRSSNALKLRCIVWQVRCIVLRSGYQRLLAGSSAIPSRWWVRCWELPTASPEVVVSRIPCRLA